MLHRCLELEIWSPVNVTDFLLSSWFAYFRNCHFKVIFYLACCFMTQSNVEHLLSRECGGQWFTDHKRNTENSGFPFLFWNKCKMLWTEVVLIEIPYCNTASNKKDELCVMFRDTGMMRVEQVCVNWKLFYLSNTYYQDCFILN